MYTILDEKIIPEQKEEIKKYLIEIIDKFEKEAYIATIILDVFRQHSGQKITRHIERWVRQRLPDGFGVIYFKDDILGYRLLISTDGDNSFDLRFETSDKDTINPDRIKRSLYLKEDVERYRKVLDSLDVYINEYEEVSKEYNQIHKRYIKNIPSILFEHLPFPTKN